MLASFSLLLGSTLLAFMFFILLLASIGFVIGIPMTAITIWLAGIGTFAYAYMGTRHYFKEQTSKILPKVCAGFLILFMGFVYISGLFYDITYDGQVYHQEAVSKLADHWNPVHEYLTPERAHSAILLNHYAKGPWIYEGALYTATRQLEESKVFNFLLIVASFLLTLSAMQQKKRFSVKQSIIFSLLMALNPVSIYQTLSFYIDGQLASALLCLFALAYRLVTEEDKLVLYSFIMSISLVVNIKFTGVVYVVACIGLVGGWLWLLKNKQLYKGFMQAAVTGLFIAICVIGYNPYITNTIFYGHPFYPLYGGKQPLDIMTSNSPIGFMEMNPLKKLYVATFSMSNNKFDTEKPILKVPFTVATEEFKPFVYGADIRIGGFGPWFSGILIIAGIIGGYMYKQKNSLYIYTAGLIVSIMITVLINPEAWWARYVPQLWLVPIIMGMVACTGDKKVMRYLGVTLVGAVIINLSMISYPYLLGNYYCTQAFNRELEGIAEEHRPLNVYFGEFTSNYVRFQRWGIEYVEVPSDIADINIENIRYKSLTALFKKDLLAGIFTEERREQNE